MRTFLKKISRHVIAISLLLSLVLPQVANAQLLTNDPILTGQIIMEYIGKVLKVAMKNVVVVGAVQLSQKVARDAAESVATWMWEGNPGKSPLTYMESPGDFIKKQGDRAVSDLLDQMSADVANANLLCVSDPTAALGVLAGLYSALKDKANVKPFGYQPGSSEFGATPDLNLGKCDAGSIAVNYQSLTNELSSDELLKRFSNAATSGGSEVDQIVAAQFDAMNSLIRAQKAAELERLNTKSHRDQTSLISGEITLPSASVAEENKTNTAKFQQEQENLQLAGILSSGAEAIPSIFATTFANAISKKIIEKLKRGKGTNPNPTGSINLSNVFGSGKSAGNSTPGSLYSDTKTVTISEGELDLLSSFTACPDKFYGTDNCVIDEGFAAAIRTADAGKPLTVKEALEQDKLHANFEMVPPAKSALNESRLCSKSAYCFSNLAKLRKARVIPIGWEIAAAAADGTGKVTLGEVVKGFNQCSYVCSNDAKKACKADSDCTTGGTCTVPTRTKENPYCHLIDPNWVLKMPEQICRAKVYGPQLQSSMGADRQEVCSDQASCLQEDSNGQCTGAFGYCLREKNTFRFEADECPAQFAGCRTYGNKEFGNVSLVDATIEAGSCTDKNTGCLGYIADYLPTGLFDESSTRVYLNGKAASCGLENIGCTEVTNSANNKQQFLRLPPASLGCKGYSNDVSACKQYAQACTVDEVGCEVYQPIGSGDAAVPGVITTATRDTSGNVLAWNDECSSECVGYASYYQAPTPIEPIQKVATAFMPQTATMCTQQVVGCDAYINVDTAAKGAGQTAYFAQPQKCSDPAIDENHAIYYSWEGSDQSGYQLRQHDLVTDKAGEPKYDVPANISDVDFAAMAFQCNSPQYKARVTADGSPNPLFNTDCRELFDKAGKPTYRLLSKTIPSTPNCVAFRKETATQDNCVASNGVFDKTTGSCTYGFLPSASTQCKAEEVGCRAYAGAAALSPKVVLNEEFITLEGWNGGESSNEGITVGDSVLKMTAATASHSIALTQGKTYNVVFWAKGQGKVGVSLGSGKSGTTSVELSKEPIAVNSDWRRFEVSSAPLPWSDSETAKIVFTRENGNVIYLENILVKEQADMVYAVKDSWVTPLSCDATPDDNIPGQALNCRSYKPKSQVNSQPVFLTGFTNLCRAQSAGCQKFVTTQNTVQVNSQVVSFGENAEKVEQKRTIPDDDFVYVIANSAASCPADKKGCSALGLKINGKLETVAKINNPSDYDSTTCKVQDEWCQTFTTPGGTSRYFKFPDSEKQCEYREKSETNGVAYTGWFKKGTTLPCYDSFVTGGNNYGIYKNQDQNFKGMVGVCAPEYNQCTEFIDHADVSRENPSGRAYYFMNNSRLDKTSCNGKVSLKDGCVLLENTDAIADTEHSTLATYCKSDPTISTSCKEILAAAEVDLADQSKDGVTVAPVKGLKNENYSSCRAAEISGLFVATDCDSQLAKLKTAGKAGGLDCSSAINVSKVQIAVDALKVVCAPLADSNTIVKVRRDRTCAEWLSCQSSLSVFDKSTQKFKDVCTDLGVCNKLSNDSGAVGQCANWVTPQQMKNDEALQRALPLTTSRYINRNVGWYGHEFSGYSLWKKFQPDTVGWFSKSQLQAESGNMLVGVGFEPADATCAKSDGSSNGSSCKAKIFADPANATYIQKEFEGANLDGVCYSQKCWYPLDGFTTSGSTSAQQFVESSCRGYPEADSPFPTSVGLSSNIFGVFSDFEQGYSNSNVCELNRFVHLQYTNGSNWTTFDDYKGAKGINPYTIPNASCDCSYKKVVFGQLSEPKYYSLDEAVIKAQKGANVVVRQKATIPGNLKWYTGKIVQSANNLFDVEYDAQDGGTESSIPPAYLAYPTEDYGSLKAGDSVVALCPTAEGWYEGKVVSVGQNIQVKFAADVVKVAKLTTDTCTILKAKNNIAVKATQKEGDGVEVPAGICNGGWFVIAGKTVPNPQAVSKKGMTCSVDYDCIDERIISSKDLTASKAGTSNVKITDQFSNDDGKCEYKTKETKFYGWKGYCLETDLSAHLNGGLEERGCLTWLPTDIGAMDIYNQYSSAAFKVSASGEGRYYCAENQGRIEKNGTYIQKNIEDMSFGYDLTSGYAGIVTSAIPGENSFYANEVDYIEVVAKKGNEFFPEGYSMNIVNDGKVRFYNYEESVNKWIQSDDSNVYENFKCPAWRVNENGQENGFDYFGSENLAALKVLSQQVRCNIKSGGLDSATCDYYDDKDDDLDKYFHCGYSENKKITYPPNVPMSKKPMAVTGVGRDGSLIESGPLGAYIPDIKDGQIGQTWFVRVDNQEYAAEVAKYVGPNQPEFTGKYVREFGDTLRVRDIIDSDASSPVVNRMICNEENFIGWKSGAAKAGLISHQQGFELRIKFGVDGKFAGIDMAGCRGTKDAENPVTAYWTVRVHMRDACMKVVKTDLDGENKAFTHRLWNAPNNGFGKYEEPGQNVTADSIVVVPSTDARVPNKQNFGSLAVVSDPKDNPLIFTHIVQKDNTGKGFGAALSGGDNAKGYSCPTGLGCLLNANNTVAPKVEFPDGQSAIHRLFAEFYTVYSGSLGYNASYTELTDPKGFVMDVSNTAEAKNAAPVIFALDPTSCSGARGGTCRMTKKYGMTVNGVYGDEETVYGKGSVVANVQFYGSADMNHLPIKRVKIEWGDNTPQLKKVGLYRNHKPICSTQSKPAAVCKISGKLDYNHTCYTNQDCVDTKGAVVGTCESNDLKWSFGSWGGTGSADEGACETGFFQFAHAYAFTSDCGGGGNKAITAATSDIAQYKLEGKVAVGERFCVFKPQVQLLDNWNICNGATAGQGGKNIKNQLDCDIEIKDYFTAFQGNIIVKE